MRRIILGQVPNEETPATMPAAQIDNCKRFREAIRAALGEEPAGSALVILVGPPVAGSNSRAGYRVGYTYSARSERQQEYADMLPWYTPLRWSPGRNATRTMPLPLTSCELGSAGPEVTG